MAQKKKIRYQVRFVGGVQGVGFRYRARQLAQMYGTTGWVENQSDYSVLMEIQGTHEEIWEVLKNLQRGTWIHVDDMQVKTIMVVEEERSFMIL